MELFIYDTSLTLLGIIDEITSLVWTRRYWSCGEFSLLLPMTERHASLIRNGHILMRREDAEAGQISYISIRRDKNGLEQIEAQGHAINDLSGTLAIAKGGTGQTTAAGARDALGLGNTTGPLPLLNGGTGANSAQAARAALGVTPGNIGAAPASHASADTGFGAASDAMYGHVKASGTTPKAHGAAAVGAEKDTFARGDHVHPVQTGVSGNAGTATKLLTPRSIAISGGATGTATGFDGSGDIAIPVTALDMGKATAGTLPIARGGTGAVDAAGARSTLGVTPGNIGAAAASHGHDRAACPAWCPLPRAALARRTLAAQGAIWA